MRETDVEPAGINPLYCLERHVAPLSHAPAQHPGTDDGQKHQRDHQGTEQGKDHRVGHRGEQFPGRTRKHVDRQEPGDDHRHRVKYGPVHLGGRLDDHLDNGSRLTAAQCGLPEDVFNHHDGSVHENAKVDRPDGQKVGRDILHIEADEREKQRQRDRRRDDQARPQIVEEEDQHDDNQQHAPQEIALDDPGRQVDQPAAIIEGVNLDVLRQDLLVKLLGLGLDGLQDVLGLFAGAHQNDPFDGVVLVHVTKLAEAGRVPDHHPADVLDEDRGTVVHGEHDVADVLDCLHPTEPAYVIELAALRVESAPGVPIIGSERIDNHGDGKPGAGDFRGVQQYLVLHRFAAKPRVIRHPGNGLVLAFNRPVFDRLEFHRRAVRTLHDVAVDQARRGKQRRHRWRDAGGQAQIPDALERLLAGEITVCAVTEGQDDIRQAVE